MSDRHLYKGKRKDNGEWVEGYYAKKGTEEYERHCIVVPTFDSNTSGYPFYFTDYEVNPSTICQCPGYKGIWEHDIFQCDEDRYQIEFSEESLTWWAESIFSSESIELGEFAPKEIEVIGNIFDNPELLEGGAE